MIKKIFIYILIILILYCYLYNPYPFSGGVIKLLYPLLLFLPFSSKAKSLVGKNRSILLSLIGVFIYSFIVFIFGGQNIWVNNFINIFECFFIPIMIISLFKQYLSKGSLINWILIVSMFASIISLYLILNPEVNLMLRVFMERGYNEATEDLRRSYGFSQFLLFTYPILLGVLVSYLLLYGRLKHYLVIILLIIAISFNARIGFFPVICSLFFVLFPFKKKNRKLGKIINLLILTVLLFGIMDYMSEEYSSTFKWLSDGVSEVSSLSSNEKEGTFYELLDNMILLPNSIIEIIIGTGHDIYLANNSSDIGYINQIWFGGCVYLFILFNVYVKIFKSLKKNIPFDFCLLLLITLLVANYKGGGFYSNEYTRFLFLLTFYLQDLDNKIIFNYNKCSH